MKRFLLLNLSISLICSCETDIDSVHMPKNEADTYSVTQGDLLSYLREYKGLGVDTKSVSDMDIKPVMQGNDTVMYIVNYEDGWEVLSADRRAPVVLMTCDSGHLDESELYMNETQSEYVNIMKTAIHNLEQTDENVVISEEDNWNSIALLAEDPDTWTDWYLTGSTTLIDTLANQDHLLATHWGQSGKWNKKAPFKDSTKTANCYTGCVMVAGSQVLYYLHHKLGCPDEIYTYSTCSAYIPDGGEYIVLNDDNISFGYSYGVDCWDLMPLSQDENVAQARFDYVSTLMSRIGYLISAKYRLTGTSANTYNLLTAFETEYDIEGSISYTADFSVVRNQICQYKLPCVFALGKSTGGHCVVADGFRDIGYFTRLFYQKHNNLAQIIRKEERILNERHQFVAINWGWDGTGDYDAETGGLSGIIQQQ